MALGTIPGGIFVFERPIGKVSAIVVEGGANHLAILYKKVSIPYLSFDL